MKILLLLLGLFLAGSADVLTQKSEILELLSKTKNAKEQLETLRKFPGTKFDYLEQLAEQTLADVTLRAKAVNSRIQELPEDFSDEEWATVKEEILQMDKQIENYYDTFVLEDSKLRHLIMAVLQCYEHKASIPEAEVFIRKVQDAILKDSEESNNDLMWMNDPEMSELLSEIVADFLHARHTVKEHEMDQKEDVKAKREVANRRVEKAKKAIMASLPIDTEERLNQALLNLAEYYRHKHRLRKFSDASEDSDVSRHIAEGDRRLDMILLPVDKPKNVHSEL